MISVMATKQAAVSFDDIIQAGKHRLSEIRLLTLTFLEDVNAKSRRSSQMISLGKEDERNRNWQKKFLDTDEIKTLQTAAVANLALAPLLPVESV